MTNVLRPLRGWLAAQSGSECQRFPRFLMQEEFNILSQAATRIYLVAVREVNVRWVR